MTQWQQQCWGNKLVCLSFNLWITSIVVHTPAEQKILLGLQLILQNLKSMVLWQNGTESILFTEKPDIVPFSFGRETIDQGSVAQLTCLISSGDMPLTITWSLKGDLISSDPTMTTTMIGRQMSMLIIQSVDYQHSGTYTCRAENPAGVTTYSAELRVNGTDWQTLKYLIYRKTWDCSLLLWIWPNWSRKTSSADLCC